MKRGTAILTIVLGAAAAATGAGTEPSDREVFQEFLGWYKTDYQGSFAPPEVIKAYTAKLTAGGVTEAEARRRIVVLQKMVSTMPREFASLHFDRIYRMEKPPFKLAASQFLVRIVEGRKAGKSLDVAMGQGRNSHYLASQGWDATGYDISEGGLAQARQLAEKAGLKVRTICASHDEFDYGTEQWDLIVETFAFTNLSDAAYRRRLIDSLKPGGMLVIEGFGNPDAKELRSPLLEGFRELRLVAYEARDEVADWGMNKARLERMAAIKP